MLEHIQYDDIIKVAGTVKCQLPEGFNWIAILKDLVAGAECTTEDATKLRTLAGYWPTCACGQLCQHLARSYDGGPKDMRLRAYGTSFYNVIEAQNWKAALALFYRIEERTTTLLQCQETIAKKLT